jgi:hypothetical protein
MESPNTAALASQWVTLGVSRDDRVRAFRGFNAFAEAFREESRAQEQASD